MKHTKKLFALMISLLLLLSIIPVRAAEIIDSGKCGDNITWTLDSNGLLIFSGEGEMYNNDHMNGDFRIVIPIPSKSLVKKVIIQNGIKDICNGALSFCENLTQVTIPDSVVKIGASVFCGTGIKEITIPAGVKYLSGAFFGCDCLENIHVAADNTKFCDIDGVLYSKNQAYLIQFPAAQRGEYTVPEGTKIICPYAFYGSNLSKIILPNSLIGVRGFDLGTNMEANTQIDCSKVGDEIFVNDISVNTADWCAAVNSGTDNDFMTDIIRKTLLFNTEEVVLSQDEKTLLKVPNNKTGTYHIPETVEVIASAAFEYSKLSVIEIPDSVKTVEYGAFSDISNLTLRYQGKEYHLERKEYDYEADDFSAGIRELLTCDDPSLLNEITELFEYLPEIVVCDNATELPSLLQNIGVYTRNMLKVEKENGVYYIADIAMIPDKPQFTVDQRVYWIREGTTNVQFGHNFSDNIPVNEIHIPVSVKSVSINHGALNMSEYGEIYYHGTIQEFSEVKDYGRSWLGHFDMDVYFLWTVPGDVSGDGETTAEDARLALRGAVGLEKYAEGSPEFLAADADKNGVLEAADARLILRAAVGLETLA